MAYIIGMFIGIAIGSFPRLRIVSNRKIVGVIENDINNMTMNRCATVKTEIEITIRNAYLYNSINKKTHDKLLNMVSDKYNGLFCFKD